MSYLWSSVCGKRFKGGQFDCTITCCVAHTVKGSKGTGQALDLPGQESLVSFLGRGVFYTCDWDVRQAAIKLQLYTHTVMIARTYTDVHFREVVKAVLLTFVFALPTSSLLTMSYTTLAQLGRCMSE